MELSQSNTLSVLGSQLALESADYPQPSNFAPRSEMLPEERSERRRISCRKGVEREEARHRIEGGQQQEEEDAPKHQPPHEVGTWGHCVVAPPNGAAQPRIQLYMIID